MNFYEIIGYDRDGTVRELDTALNKGTLTTRDCYVFRTWF